MKRMLVMMLVLTLAAVSSIPVLPAGADSPAMNMKSCPYCHMNMASMDHIGHALTPAMRHCRIECCGHHDADGLPHLLAPHTVSLAGLGAGLMIADVVDAGMPVLKSRLLPFPTPPPRSI